MGGESPATLDDNSVLPRGHRVGREHHPAHHTLHHQLHHSTQTHPHVVKVVLGAVVDGTSLKQGGPAVPHGRNYCWAPVDVQEGGLLCQACSRVFRVWLEISWQAHFHSAWSNVHMNRVFVPNK